MYIFKLQYHRFTSCQILRVAVRQLSKPLKLPELCFLSLQK